MTNDERIQKALEIHDGTLQHLVDKGRIILTVNVADKEQAEQLLEWLYAPEKPMKSELIELAWDKVAVKKDEADLLEHMREVLLNS